MLLLPIWRRADRGGYVAASRGSQFAAGGSRRGPAKAGRSEFVHPRL